MSLKVCFNNQIHKLSKFPETFKILSDYIIPLFSIQLPQTWALQYTDSDGDAIMISDEHDYQSMKEDQLGSGVKTTKIYIIPVKQNMNQSLQQSKASIPEARINVTHPNMADNNADFCVISEANLERPVAIEEKQITKKNSQKEEEWHKVSPKQNKTSKRSSKRSSRTSLTEKNKPRIEESVQNIGEEFVIKQKDERTRKNRDRHLHRLDEKETNKKANLREEIRSVLAEFVPIIASLAKDLLKEEMAKEDLKESQKMKVLNQSVSQEEKHEGVFCNGCNQQDFMGTRYKCSVCPDFDYCETCEAEKEHLHPFIKMTKPLSFSFHPIPNDSNSKAQKKSPKSSEKHENIKKVKEESKESPKLVNAPPEDEKRAYLSYSDEEEDEEDMKIKHKNVGYSREVKEKAKKLQEIFSFADLADLRKFVSQAPEMSLEELIEKMLLQ